jgi:hypothetical protein
MDNKRIVKRVYETSEMEEAKGTTKENMEGRITRGDKKERSNMERSGKDSKVEGPLEPCLHRKVEEDGISEVSEGIFVSVYAIFFFFFYWLLQPACGFWRPHF